MPVILIHGINIASPTETYYTELSARNELFESAVLRDW
jgi:hypothetical protein